MRSHLRLLIAVVVAVLVSLPGFSAGAAVPSHSLIVGSGSSWSSNAVNQWVADVQTNGLQVVFTPNGSAGRDHMGLGMLTDLAEEAGGSLVVDSQPGVGTTLKLEVQVS